MEIIVATELIFPRATNANAISIVIMEALTGSLSFSLPFASHLFNDFIGKDLSLANACSVLGATITEPRAEEIVEAAKPRGIAIAP